MMLRMNPATCLAQDSHGIHTWMTVQTRGSTVNPGLGLHALHDDAARGQICSNTGCACFRQVDDNGKSIPGTFLKS